MTATRFETLRALLYSLLVHLAIVLLLGVSVTFDALLVPSHPEQSRIVQAVAVDQNQVAAEVERLRRAEERERREQQAREQRLAEDLEKAKRAREAEEARIARLKEEREKIERQKVEEQKRLAEAEAKRKREEEQQRLAEQKRKEEEQRRKQEEEARRQQELQEALAAEERARAEAEQNSKDVSAIAQYAQQIKAKITSVFINPAPGAKLSCVILIRMIPGGDVVSATITRSSGNAAFDRQAETAVHKAAPLPVPADPRLFQKMREIEIVFDLAP
jgi:colicin import membrane protein